MLTDQEQYLKYMQITSDVVCFILLYLIVVPTAVIAVNCWGSQSLPALLLSYENSCIYKSIPYALGALTGIFISGLVSLGAASMGPVTTHRVKALFLIPLCLCLINLWLLRQIFDALCLPREPELQRLAISMVSLIVLLLLNRLNIVFLMKNNQSHPFLIKHIAIAGTGEAASSLARYIRGHPETGLRLKGFVSTEPLTAPHTVDGIPVLGSVADLPDVVHGAMMDMVLVPDSSGMETWIDFLFKTCATMGIELGTDIPLTCVTERVFTAMQKLNGTNIVLYKFVNITALNAFRKRVFDFTGSSFLIFVSLPFWIVVPLMIKFSSKGPIFFRQKRIGKSGRKFTLYKFRSMYQDAESRQEDLMHLNEMDGPAFKIKEDPRQTPTGRVLRKHSLDELPQLFNVFKGDISLVGPRPAMEGEVFQYRLTERRRLSVIQGITCIWQVSGRNEIKFDEWMKLDLMYIDHWSFASDFKILFKTIPAVLLKRGAY